MDAGLSWTAACIAFTEHFQSSDTDLVLEREFDALKQGKGEHVQEYAEKFMDLVAQLVIPDDERTVLKFVKGLQPAITRAYLVRIGVRADIDPAFDWKRQPLAQVIKTCIRMDVEFRTAQEASHGLSGTSAPATPVQTGGTKGRMPPGTKSTGSMSTGTKRDSNDPSVKVCKHHPGSRSHDTANCHIELRGNPKPEGSPQSGTIAQLPKKLADTTPGTASKPVTCYTCHKEGHKSPDCPSKAGGTKATKMLSVVAAVAVDRTLPESVVCPDPPAKCPQFWLNNACFDSLPDTGSEISVMDRKLALKHNIKVNPIAGELKMANETKMNRIGQTDPVTVTVLFPNSDLEPKTLTHRFEVMDMASEEYSFLVGMDLIKSLFVGGLPHQFVPDRHSVAPKCTGVRLASVSVCCDSSPSLIEMVPSEPKLELPDSETRLFTVRTLSAVELNDSTAKSMGLPTDMSDPGTTVSVPASDMEEPAVRVELSTSAERKAEYDTQRGAIASNPALIQALATNELISGFCNLPESVVHLDVSPEDECKLYQSQYKIAQALHEAATPDIERWFKTGKTTLAPPGCKHNNPITVAPKKDKYGNWTRVRVCLDTRNLNRVLRNGDNFQLPYIRAALDRFAGCVIFGQFDLFEAYLQFLLDVGSQSKTAFTWNGVQYMFVSCPFGINFLPSHFQRVMCSLFHDLPFTFPYLDNLPIGSRRWYEHADHLLIVVDRLNQANLKIKIESIEFGQSQMRVLGGILSENGLGIDPKKASAVLEWVLPATGKDLQSFLGLFTYVRDHVRHAAELTGPLEAVKNEKIIVWNDSMKEHFELVKKAIASAPWLKLPDFEVPFYIATDASNTGVGGVLYQPGPDDNGDVTPRNIVAICSKKLSESQRNYSAYKKELYGIVYCLKQFHCYVWGRTDLVIVTDHKPLTYMLVSPDLSEALRRWLDTILDYQFKIVHRPGVLNVVPDALSRMYGSVYSGSPTWGVTTAAALASALSELGVRDFSLNEPPVGAVRTITVSANAHPCYVATSNIAGAGLGLFANQEFLGPKKRKRCRTKLGQFITEYTGKLLVVGSITSNRMKLIWLRLLMVFI